jgi:ubiquinone/menaquinone biosynthesis C-methylase UbiE
MVVSGRAREERERFDAFYREKWREHEGFWIDRYPPEHAVYAAAVYGRRNEAILEAAGPNPGTTLDLGCGLGDLARAVADTGARVVATDVSIENARRSRENLGVSGTPALVVQGEGEHLPFGDAAFDLVILADVIEHVDSVGATLREVARVLRFRGRLICVTPLRGTLLAMQGVDRTAYRIARPAKASSTARPIPAVHERFLSASELRGALVAAGLRPIRFERVCFYPAPETAGAFGAVMARLHRRGDESRFQRISSRASRVFGLIERLQIFNQKQLWVARR